MKHFVLPLLAAVAVLFPPAAHAADKFSTNGFDFAIAAGPWSPDTNSFAANYRCPDWFRDAKFGIYMHWGLNSVPGYNGHYARYMYFQNEPAAAKTNRISGYKPGMEAVYNYHVEMFGHPSKFGYKDFIPLWQPTNFNAAALAKFYKQCGARYVGVMAVHHDNFDLFNSPHHRWNSVSMNPHRDIVGEWKRACVKENLRLAITTHLSNEFHEHAFYQGGSDTTGPLAGVPYDTQDPQFADLYGVRTPDRLRVVNPLYAQKWFLRLKSLIDQYDPDQFYLDGPLPNGAYGLNLAAHYFNNNFQRRGGKMDGVFTIKRTSPAGFTFDVESAGVGEGLAQPWQVDTTLNPGWFHLGARMAKAEIPDDAGGIAAGNSASQTEDVLRLNAGQVIDNLADIVSKNGNMLLNVGLRADGSLPETFRRELIAVGRWLDANGEAIYGTRPFRVFGEGPFQMPGDKGHFNDHTYTYTAEDIRFTQSKDGKTIYAILLDWPKNRAFTIKSLDKHTSPKAAAVTLLATGEQLPWRQDTNGLHITLPAQRVGEFAHVVKISDIPLPPPATLPDVPYGKHPRQVLDFWKADSTVPTPLVFFIHGGGWYVGDKSQVEQTITRVTNFLAQGISVASINYRFIPQAEADGAVPPVKGPLDDAARALQFVRSKAGEWNIDPQRIALAGSSAGGCASLWLAFHDDLANPNSSDPIARQSTKPLCAAVYVAQTSLDPQQMREWIPNSDYGAHAFGIRGDASNPTNKISSFDAFIAARERILPWINEYSPYALVTPGDPPVGLFYRTAPSGSKIKGDPTHSANFGVKLEERCRALGVECEFSDREQPGIAHTNIAAYLIGKLKPAAK